MRNLVQQVLSQIELNVVSLDNEEYEALTAKIFAVLDTGVLYASDEEEIMDRLSRAENARGVYFSELQRLQRVATAIQQRSENGIIEMGWEDIDTFESFIASRTVFRDMAITSRLTREVRESLKKGGVDIHNFLMKLYDGYMALDRLLSV